MKKFVFFGLVIVFVFVVMGVMVVEGDMLKEVKVCGVLNCGVNIGLIGFVVFDVNGNWIGFDVVFCKVVVVVVLGDVIKVKYVLIIGQMWFIVLFLGEVDFLVCNLIWMFQCDIDLKFDFVGVNYFDGQGFMVCKDLGVLLVKELDGVMICIQIGIMIELNLVDYFKVNNMIYQLVNIDSNVEGEQQYMVGVCDVYIIDVLGLVVMCVSFVDLENYIILFEIILKELFGLVVCYGDNNWGDIMCWMFYVLIVVEEYGVILVNIEELLKFLINLEVQCLLGMIDNLGGMIGFDVVWVKNVIKVGGNYGEIFVVIIGEQILIGLVCGLNV